LPARVLRRVIIRVTSAIRGALTKLIARLPFDLSPPPARRFACAPGAGGGENGLDSGPRIVRRSVNEWWMLRTPKSRRA
jgi:hypothetical protein